MASLDIRVLLSEAFAIENLYTEKSLDKCKVCMRSAQQPDLPFQYQNKNKFSTIIHLHEFEMREIVLIEQYCYSNP